MQGRPAENLRLHIIWAAYSFPFDHFFREAASYVAGFIIRRVSNTETVNYKFFKGSDMSDQLDDWATSRFISWDRAHAVGLIALYWNFCEDGVRSLLINYSGMNDFDGEHFTYDMNTVSMTEKIKSLISHKENERIIIDQINHILQAVEICRKNRNNIIHSWTNIKGDKLFLSKLRKNIPSTYVFDFNVTKIRKVADEIFSVGHFLIFLNLYLSSRDNERIVQSLPNIPPIPQEFEIIDKFGPKYLT